MVLGVVRKTKSNWLRGLDMAWTSLIETSFCTLGPVRTSDLAHFVRWPLAQIQSRNKEKRPVRRRVIFLGSS